MANYAFRFLSFKFVYEKRGWKLLRSWCDTASDWGYSKHSDVLPEKKKRRRKRDRKKDANHNGNIGSEIGEKSEKRDFDEHVDILDGDRDRDNGIDVDVESSTSEQWVAMRLIDPCKDEDEAIARRALNKLMDLPSLQCRLPGRNY